MKIEFLPNSRIEQPNCRKDVIWSESTPEKVVKRALSLSKASLSNPSETK
ncbi:MAG: hypothetical protein ACXAC7_20980 [Candidatus Hodarchaeales archaeon]|jgi:hypothetical protein